MKGLKKIMFLLSVTAIAMYIAVGLNLLYDKPLQWRFWLSIIFTFITSIFCVVDILKNQPKEKRIWIAIVILFLAVGSFAYLIQRKEDEKQ